MTESPFGAMTGRYPGFVSGRLRGFRKMASSKGSGVAIPAGFEPATRGVEIFRASSEITEAAGLRYAQAQLDEQEKIAKSGDVSVTLLDKILSALLQKTDHQADHQAQQNVDKLGKSTPLSGNRTESENQGAGFWDGVSRTGSHRTVASDHADPNAGLHSVESGAKERGQRSIHESPAPRLKQPWPHEEIAPHIRKPLFSDKPYDPREDGLTERDLRRLRNAVPYGGLPEDFGGTYGDDGQFHGRTQQQPQQPHVPLPQPRPPEADQQKQGALPDASQLNGLSTAFAGFIQGVVEELNKGKAQTTTGTDAQPVQSADARQAPSGDTGDDLDQSAGQVDDSLKGLASAVAEAANSIRGAGAEAGQEPTYAATGGLITGPGSTVSDSIPAMLSNKEFVVNAASAEKHIGLLHAINSGRDILHFAVGGPVGIMGNVGLPSISGATVASSSAGGAGQHFGTVDLRTDHGDFKVTTERDTMRHLNSAAQKAKRYTTGTKPGWYGGSK
ncbi:hypothetical protein ACVW1C_008089 [Bradyrhizobium sp. USDA 4011]